MASADAAQLIRIARLRRFVAVFARGGDLDATAEALTELAQLSRTRGLAAEALRRARQAAQLLAEQETGEAGARALLHLGSLCLDTGAADAAASAAALARSGAAELPEPARSELTGAAALLAGMAHALGGDEDAARTSLSEARDLLVAADQPAAAALALVQQGLLDVATARSDAAEVCFAYAREFYRAARLPLAAVEVAMVAARAFAEIDEWTHAEPWFATAIGEADRAGATQLAAELTVDHAAELERAEQPDEALRIANDAAARCALLGDDGAAVALRSRVRLQLARLAPDPRDAVRHLEAVFDVALARRDAESLGRALDVLVSGIVRERFAPSTWHLVEQFRDRLVGAGFEALGETAANALADLRR